jgi:hypothetical protein
MPRIHATDREANMSDRMAEGAVMTEGKKPWTPEDQRRVEQRMVDKDDHFGLPEEGTVERAMIRRRAQRALDAMAAQGKLPAIKLGEKGPIAGMNEFLASRKPR